MLVLTRKEGEAIRIAKQIRITVLKTGHRIRLGIEAPDDVEIVRAELQDEEVVLTVPLKPAA
jgi:carbon storage regulator CsrA